MMPQTLLISGLKGALEDLAGKIQGSGIDCSLEVFGKFDDIDESVQVSVYRLFQEMVNNVLKHAHAQAIHLQMIRHENNLNISVEDDGIGFNYELAKSKKSMGLENIESRVKFLDGDLNIDTVHMVGTSINIDIPLEDILDDAYKSI